MTRTKREISAKSSRVRATRGHVPIRFIYIYWQLAKKKTELIARSAALLKLTRFTRTIITHQRAINRVKGNFFYTKQLNSNEATGNYSLSRGIIGEERYRSRKRTGLKWTGNTHSCPDKSAGWLIREDITDHRGGKILRETFLFFFFPNKRMRFLFSFLVKTAAATAAMAATAESEIFITVVRNAVKN